MTPDKRAHAAHKAPISGGGYVSAAEAMAYLGVNAQTLYAYVSRKGIRSRPVPGSRQRRYWMADVEQLRRAKKAPDLATPSIRQESEITLIGDNALFYRGQNAAELAQRASFEAVAALLWGVKEEECFVDSPPRTPALWARLNKLLAHETSVDRATALFPLLEEANPKAFDFSPLSMARTGADILRCLAAITVHAAKPTTEPIHLLLARELKLPAEHRDLVRRMLVLSADHGFERGANAVRALASTGVTPWRSVISGLSVILGRESKLVSFDSISRLVTEITTSPDARSALVHRMRLSDTLPGFGSDVYPNGDPRARALLGFCKEMMPGDIAFRRLWDALQTVKEIRGLEPNFALACIFVDTRIGFIGPRESLFPMGRAAGWIAHAIEQHQHGEMKRQRGLYKGPLP
jgi:citrate synthase